jgi:hypothetical protein
MHARLLANFSFRQSDMLVGPPLQRLPPQKLHLLDDPLFSRVRLLEISLRVLYRPDYRRNAISKIRMCVEKRKQSFATHFRRRHLLKLRRLPNRQHTTHHFESHPSNYRKISQGVWFGSHVYDRDKETLRINAPYRHRPIIYIAEPPILH